MRIFGQLMTHLAFINMLCNPIISKLMTLGGLQMILTGRSNTDLNKPLSSHSDHWRWKSYYSSSVLEVLSWLTVEISQGIGYSSRFTYTSLPTFNQAY